MRAVLGTVIAISLLGGFAAWSTCRTGAQKIAVGTHPGGVGPGKILDALPPAQGDSLIAFSSGCFWGAEEAFRKVPGVVATAVGYTGGTSVFPSYEVAHRTGHLETVLVEFNPRLTPLDALLKVFWTLPRSQTREAPSKSSYRATIWTYDSSESAQALRSRTNLEKSLHHKLAVNILAAQPFYLAEDFHQQYNEKSGKDLCFAKGER